MRIKRIAVSLLILMLLVGNVLGISVSAVSDEQARATPSSQIFTTPSSEFFNDLWVGDVIFLSGWQGSPVSVTLLSGDGVEVQEYEGKKTLRFTKPGKSSVRIKVKTEEKTFSFTVSPRPADKPVKLNPALPSQLKIKLGKGVFPIDYLHFENLNYGWTPAHWYPLETQLSESAAETIGLRTDLWEFATYIGDISSRQVNADRRFDKLIYEGEIFWRPGTATLQPVYRGEPVGNPCTVIFEEPVITTNAPATVPVNSTFTLTTALTNLAPAVKNLKTAAYADTLEYEKDPKKYHPFSIFGSETFQKYYGAYFEEAKKEAGGDYDKEYDITSGAYIAYQPRVEVVEGADIVQQSGQDYSNTLSTSETLTFKKAGTVKLKVTYRQFATTYAMMAGIGEDSFLYGEDDRRFHPEKIITMQVMDGSGTTAPATGGSTTGSVPAANPPSSAGSSAGGSTTGGSAGMSQGTAPGESSPAADPSAAGTVSTPAPSLPPVEERPVVLTDGETGIQLGAEEGVLPPDTALVVKPSDFVLTDAAGQFTAFDISLENGGARIQPDGRVQVSIPIPAGYDRKRLAVYHIAEDGTRTELPSAVVGEAITFETAHFSLYVVAEKAAAQAAGVASLPGGKPAEKGGSPVIWIILCVVLAAAAGGGFALWYVKFRKKE